MNSAVSKSTGKSPHEIVFGRPSFDPYTSILSSQVIDDAPGVQEFAATRQLLYDQVREAIAKAQGKYTQQADKHRRPSPFAADQWVMLSTTNLRLKGYTSRKLQPRFIGPFRIISCHRTSYRLDLPPTMQHIHPTFHASLLQPYHGTPPSQPSPVLVEDQEEYEVDSLR